MYIKNENQATRRLYDADIMGDDYPSGIEFDEDGVARVNKSVGEALAQSDDYPGITVEAEEKPGGEPDLDPAADDDDADEPGTDANAETDEMTEDTDTDTDTDSDADPATEEPVGGFGSIEESD